MLHKNKFALLSVAIFLALSVLVIAGQQILPSSFSTSTNTTRYNVTINITSPAVNLTYINITLPTGFTFLTGSNQTISNAVVTFSNTSTVLSWYNITFGAITNGINASFLFNATANTTTIGAGFNFTVETVNGSTTNNTNISVTVLDHISPSSNIIDSPLNGGNVSALVIRANSTENNWRLNLTNGGIFVLIHNGSYGFMSANTTFVYMNNTNVSGNLNISVSTFALPDGVYYINITSNDSANNRNVTSSQVNVTIDTVRPSNIAFNTTSTSNYANVSAITVNISATDVGVIGKNGSGLAKFVVYIFDSSHSYVGNTNITGNASNLTTTGSATLTGLANGTYVINITAADHANNINATGQTRTFTIDTEAPTVTISRTNASTTGTTIVADVVGSDATSGTRSCNLVGSTTASIAGSTGSWTITESDLTCGTSVEYTVSCTDYAGNNRTQVQSISTNNCGSGSVGSSGSGSGSSSSTWGATFSLDSQELTAKGVTSQSLSSNQRAKIKVNKETHYVGVKSLTSTSASLEITSTPQYAVVNIGESKKFDLNADGTYDLKVTLVSITSGKANFTFEAISEKIVASTTGSSLNESEEAGEVISGENENSEGSSNLMIIIWVIVALAIIAVVFFLVRRQR